MTPVPLIRKAAGPRYPLVTVAAQADREALLRDLSAGLELHGVPCPFIEEIIEGAGGLEGGALRRYLERWVVLR